MEIIDAVYNFFRNINTDSKAIKIERITHIILLIASGIIIFRWIQGYYDLLDLVKLPLCQTANYNRVQQQIKIPSDTYQTARSCL